MRQSLQFCGHRIAVQSVVLVPHARPFGFVGFVSQISLIVIVTDADRAPVGAGWLRAGIPTSVAERS
jgi:hypothetical protein